MEERQTNHPKCKIHKVFSLKTPRMYIQSERRCVCTLSKKLLNCTVSVDAMEKRRGSVTLTLIETAPGRVVVGGALSVGS